MQRPIGVTIIAVFNLVSGPLGILFSFGILTSGGSGSLHDTAFAISRTVLGLLLGILATTAGVGMLRCKGWAWRLGIILQGLGTVNVAINLANGYHLGPTIALEMLNVIALIYLIRPQVRAAFGLAPTPPVSPLPHA